MQRGGVEIVRMAEVTSTMDVAKRLVLERMQQDPNGGDAPGASTPPSHTKPFLTPIAVIADRQTAGRGTTGRAWTSPSGNLHMSLAVPASRLPVAVLPMLPLLVGMSIRTSIYRHVATGLTAEGEGAAESAAGASKMDRLLLKWPNDVLCDGLKVAGVLVEPAEDGMIIGIGVNVATTPDGTLDGGRTPTSLAAYFGDRLWRASAEQLGTDCANTILARLDAVLAACDGNASGSGGLAGVRARAQIVADFTDAMAKDITLHLRVPGAARLDSGPAVRPVALNEWGHLIVDHADGRRETLVAEYLN